MGGKSAPFVLLKNASFFRFQTNCSFLKESTYQLILISKWFGPLDFGPRVHHQKPKKNMFTMGLVTSAVGVWWCVFFSHFHQGIRYVKGKPSRSHNLCAHCVPRDSYKPASIEYILDLTPHPAIVATDGL